jgi:hypothetical protein
MESAWEADKSNPLQRLAWPRIRSLCWVMLEPTRLQLSGRVCLC